MARVSKEQFMEETKAIRLALFERIGHVAEYNEDVKAAMKEFWGLYKEGKVPTKYKDSFERWVKNEIYPPTSVELVEDVLRAEEQIESPHEEPVSDDVDTSTTMSTHLDEHIIARLLKMLQWWEQSQKDEQLIQTTERPKFKGLGEKESVTKTVRIRKDMLQAVERKLKRDSRSGGSFSSLTVWLLWEYLDRDPRFLATEDESADPSESR